ncbi:WecB/TagA/CpsF family glycosyltransferase [Cohaesibacter haloalkalitolerans]|uniref:WecB/TagA/CpsF family glycosyltransferase n=1 Tax=Cohaesibacter haloalkalitolerans TaxID=1162980 RepID=UPI000E6598B2|nr:WecB/TagA/CpsF family glycosyltransferase [Cohaesibacter haloalkalitolerans]
MNDIPKITVGGLPIAVEDCDGAARTMLEHAYDSRGKGRKPLYVTSANGQVLSMCASDSAIRELFLKADLIHADGTPLVKAARLLAKTPLPERVATTDLVHNAARMAEKEKASFYFLGATQEGIEKAVANMKRLYPDLIFAGYRNGYVSADEEQGVIDEINRAAPDILWIGMGVPLEQRFVARNLEKLTGVGVVKTSGGLFDFLSGKNSRAPQWMQDVGLEWAYRIYQEPGRLFWRYLTTNPHAVWLLLTRTR